jgi:hypothetical protein
MENIMLLEEVIPFKSKKEKKKEAHRQKVKDVKKSVDDFQKWKDDSSAAESEHKKKMKKDFEASYRRSKIKRVK